jgi:hypothetical protein
MRRCRLENRQTGWPTKSRKSGAEIFVGDRGLRAAYKILLKNAAKGNVLRYLYPFEGYRPVASLFYYLRMHLSQKQKEMDQRGIAALGFKKSEHYEKLPKRHQHALSALSAAGYDGHTSRQAYHHIVGKYDGHPDLFKRDRRSLQRLL